jgi:hypothetical protein
MPQFLEFFYLLFLIGENVVNHGLPVDSVVTAVATRRAVAHRRIYLAYLIQELGLILIETIIVVVPAQSE